MLVVFSVLVPVKFAEASWLLELGFYCFSSYSCDFGHAFCYFGCPKSIRPSPFPFGQGFRVEGIAKTMFSPKSFSGDSTKADLFVFLFEALGTSLLTFSALETGLKIKCF